MGTDQRQARTLLPPATMANMIAITIAIMTSFMFVGILGGSPNIPEAPILCPSLAPGDAYFSVQGTLRMARIWSTPVLFLSFLSSFLSSLFPHFSPFFFIFLSFSSFPFSFLFLPFLSFSFLFLFPLHSFSFIFIEFQNKTGGILVIYWHESNQTPDEVITALGTAAINDIISNGGVVAAPYTSSLNLSVPWTSSQGSYDTLLADQV